MAVTTTDTSANFMGTGVSSSYAPGFYVNSSDQVEVYVDSVLKTLGVDYVVNGVGASAGCTIVGTFTGGSAVYIERVTPLTQLVDTQNNETILEDVLDAEFDKLTMIAQELNGKTDRAILLPKGESPGVLPAASVRKGKILGFDAATGLPIPVAVPNGGTDAALISWQYDPNALARSVAFRLTHDRIKLSDWCNSDGTDQSVQFGKLVAHINTLPRGAAVEVDREQILLSAGTTFTITKAFGLFGDGEAISQIIFANNTQLVCSGAAPGLYTGTQFIFERVGLRVSGVHTSGPLKITFATGGAGTTASCTLRDCSVQCHQAASGFQYGVWLDNCSAVRIDNVRVEGLNGTYPIASVAGVKFTGVGSDYHINALSVFWCLTGVTGLGDIEGARFDHITMVAVRKGIDWQTTPGIGFNPWFSLVSSHINAEEICVRLLGEVEFVIANNELYNQVADAGGAGTAQFIYVDTQYNGGVTLNGRIADNMLQGDLSPVSQANRTGIYVNGRAADNENLIIESNQFQSLGKCVDLSANTNGVKFLSSNQYNNVTTIVNSASPAGSNLVAGTTLASPCYSIVDDQGNKESGGSAVVTLDASGDGNFTYAGLGLTAFSTFLSAMVCSGEPGVTGGDKTFAVVHNSCTANALYFSVRPNPGAVVVRVQFIAKGRQ